jgi:hypothetical protein
MQRIERGWAKINKGKIKTKPQNKNKNKHKQKLKRNKNDMSKLSSLPIITGILISYETSFL